MPLRLALPTVLVLLSACAPAPDGVTVHDPYEEQNRRVHEFNKAIDERVFGQLGGSGESIDPELKQTVVNFADNVALPGMVLNGLLQADIGGAATNTMRFLINTTVGVGGLLDPAGAIGLTEEETDFGETLAVWNFPEGAYLELPILGPSTERAFAGRIVDAIIDPLDSVGTRPQKDYGTLSTLAGRAIKRDQFGDTIDSVLRDSADSYAQQRLIYLQNRRFELGTTPESESVDPYDELFGDQ
ncbi:phospholipid-binding lipoprotein MlaA [Cognatiyoonia koreensis]|uniref:Phospholipid-binding lipoprotein MlaA n=1 Tax=Cognatiyoonia koreensis TaxID=364200 RepID=A0A1I0REQ8_9RHOB|nr:phospholipid-binding lipoprotein MlaA [Cognatiyoonia koreensis]